MDIYLAEPRGFCAGVRRAIFMVENALAQYGRSGLCASRNRSQ